MFDMPEQDPRARDEDRMVRILSYGAVLWDVIGGREYIGGAPFNLAAHAAQLGGEAWLVSRVGADERGRAALAEMERLGVKTELVQQDGQHPTGWVDVALSGKGQPAFTIHEPVAFDFIAPEADLWATVSQLPVDAFCYGTLEQRAPVTRQTLFKLLDVVPARQFFYDVNLRQNYFSAAQLHRSLIHSTIVKLNAEEVRQLGPTLYGGILSEEKFVARVAGAYPRVRIVCVTKGERGCTVYWAGRRQDCPGIPVEVADTVGAGDAFSAAFLLRYCTGSDPFESARFANRIGAVVASQHGAVPQYSPEIRALIEAEARV